MAILFSLQANSIGDESKGIIWKQGMQVKHTQTATQYKPS